MSEFSKNDWALILGGSSGIGLASAQKLAREGMSVCVVHRDRRGAMERIEAEFARIREQGYGFLSLNLDALSEEGMSSTLSALVEKLGSEGRIKVLLHSIALGNLKPLVAPKGEDHASQALSKLAEKLGIESSALEEAVRSVPEEALYSLTSSRYGEAVIDDEDMARTIYSMGTSLLSWVQRLHRAGLFARDARVLGLTSEGNEVAWRGYAAVSAAKAALEAVSRSIAVEYAPYGVRCNILQPGVTDTPALRAIPGSERMKFQAALRNPLQRLTTPEDVAGVVYLLSRDEAAWINGTLIRVDGGEHVASA